MPTSQTMVAFLIVSVGVVIAPGPSNLFLMAHGIGHGRRSALAALIGMETASAVRIVVTATGLAALLASSAVVFGVIRWVGVAYLTYLGVQAARRQPGHDLAPSTRDLPIGHSMWQGLLASLANPKMVIFYLALFPQFIHSDQGSPVGQMLILGAIFWIIGTLWDLALACTSATPGARLANGPRARALRSRFEAITYFGLAGWTALTGNRANH